MKRLFFFCMLLTATCTTAIAQDDGFVLNHVGFGVEAGTTGIGVEVAAPVSKYLAIRAGLSFMPTIKVKDIKVDVSGQESSWKEGQAEASDFHNNFYPYLNDADKAKIDAFNDYIDADLPSDVLVTGELSTFNWKVLVDVYPISGSSFHITGGVYMGKERFVDAYTTNCKEQFAAVSKFNETLAGQTMSVTNPVTGVSKEYTFHSKFGVEMGDYLLEPTGDHAEAYIKVKKVKPYVGIGFGRAVPYKHRLAFNFDLGAWLWGTPGVYSLQPNGEKKIDKSGIDGDGDAIKIISKVSVYPCMTFRLSGRIF